MWSRLRWEQLCKRDSCFLQRLPLRVSHTNCETSNEPTESSIQTVVKTQDLAQDGVTTVGSRRRWKSSTDTSFGRQLLREWQLNPKQDRETLFSLASRLGYYGPSIHRIIETGDILSLKRVDSERYFSFLLENISTIVPLSDSLYEKAQQEIRERSEHLEVYLEVLLCSGQLEKIYDLYSQSPRWAMVTSSVLKPCLYVYSMAALWLLGDQARCKALLSKVRGVMDVRTKDNFGFGVLETLRNVDHLEAAMQWLEFCRMEQVTLTIPCTFLEPFVDNHDNSHIEKILCFCSEYDGANVIYEGDENMRQMERKKNSESILKVAIYLLENKEWSLRYIKEEQLLDVIINHIQDSEALYGFLDGLCILSHPIQPSWIYRLLSLKSSESGTSHFLTPSLLVSLLQRSKAMSENVAYLVLEWVKEWQDFPSACRLLELLESQSFPISSVIAKLYIQLAAEITSPDEITNVELNDHVRFSDLKQPSHVICHLEGILQYLESRGTLLSYKELKEIERTLQNVGLVQALSIIRKRLPLQE